jgi:chromosome partitioning protein
MIITIASLKGGVGKTTTAVHLAAYLQNQADTLLIDADTNRSALGWAKRGKLPFDVVDEWQIPDPNRQYDHVVIDAQARLMQEDLVTLAENCDLLILPTTPSVLSLDALTMMLELLAMAEITRYRILMTLIPPQSKRAVEQVRNMLEEANLPLFATGIRSFSAFQKAALSGTPVYEVKDPKSIEAWSDYQNVGRELLELFGL